MLFPDAHNPLSSIACVGKSLTTSRTEAVFEENGKNSLMITFNFEKKGSERNAKVVFKKNYIE